MYRYFHTSMGLMFWFKSSLSILLLLVIIIFNLQISHLKVCLALEEVVVSI